MLALMLCFCCVASSYDCINGNLVVVMHLMLIRPSVSQYVLWLPQAQVFFIPIINLISCVCCLFLLSGLFKSTHLCRLLQMPSLLCIPFMDPLTFVNSDSWCKQRKDDPLAFIVFLCPHLISIRGKIWSFIHKHAQKIKTWDIISIDKWMFSVGNSKH